MQIKGICPVSINVTLFWMPWIIIDRSERLIIYDHFSLFNQSVHVVYIHSCKDFIIGSLFVHIQLLLGPQCMVNRSIVFFSINYMFLCTVTVNCTVFRMGRSPRVVWYPVSYHMWYHMSWYHTIPRHRHYKDCPTVINLPMSAYVPRRTSYFPW